MTRNRKVDPEVLEREYIFDRNNPPISYTQLAEKHGVARNTVAEKATKGRWYERRKEFRESLGEKVVEALGEEWVRFETAAREKAMDIALNYMNKYEAAMEAGEIKVSTRDFLGVMAMLRTFLGDAAQAKTNGEEVLFDSESADLDPIFAREVLNRLEAGERRTAEAPAETGPEGAGED